MSGTMHDASCIAPHACGRANCSGDDSGTRAGRTLMLKNMPKPVKPTMFTTVSRMLIAKTGFQPHFARMLQSQQKRPLDHM